MIAATNPDTAPITWGYVLGAIAVAAACALLLLGPAYLDSDFHRRGVARLRAHRQKGTTR